MEYFIKFVKKRIEIYTTKYRGQPRVMRCRRARYACVCEGEGFSLKPISKPYTNERKIPLQEGIEKNTAVGRTAILSF